MVVSAVAVGVIVVIATILRPIFDYPFKVFIAPTNIAVADASEFEGGATVVAKIVIARVAVSTFTKSKWVDYNLLLAMPAFVGTGFQQPPRAKGHTSSLFDFRQAR